jgi:cytochrome c-type biogenesis protein CcmH
LQRGDSDDLILQAFVQKYGATVLAAPTTTGFNRVAWIMPFAALGAGILAVVYVVRLWRARQPIAVAAAAGSVPVELDEYHRRARQETEL